MRIVMWICISLTIVVSISDRPIEFSNSLAGRHADSDELALLLAFKEAVDNASRPKFDQNKSTASSSTQTQEPIISKTATANNLPEFNSLQISIELLEDDSFYSIICKVISPIDSQLQLHCPLLDGAACFENCNSYCQLQPCSEAQKGNHITCSASEFDQINLVHQYSYKVAKFSTGIQGMWWCSFGQVKTEQVYLDGNKDNLVANESVITNASHSTINVLENSGFVNDTESPTFETDQFQQTEPSESQSFRQSDWKLTEQKATVYKPNWYTSISICLLSLLGLSISVNAIFCLHTARLRHKFVSRRPTDESLGDWNVDRTKRHTHFAVGTQRGKINETQMELNGPLVDNPCACQSETLDGPVDQYCYYNHYNDSVREMGGDVQLSRSLLICTCFVFGNL